MPDRPRNADDDPEDRTGPLMLTPRRPEEVPPDREMSTLLDDFHHVHWQLLQQRHGLADPVPADVLVPAGLAELAWGAALIDRLQSLRWQTMIGVLAVGGSLTDCAAAMGLAEDQSETVSARLQRCATTQHKQGRLTGDDYRQAVELIASARTSE